MLNIWYANDLPYGPRPIWARAHMGPGPLGPGPFLVGQTPHQKTHPGKKSPNCVFCVCFLETKKMRDVRTIILAAVSRRDLCYASGNEGFRFCGLSPSPAMNRTNRTNRSNRTARTARTGRTGTARTGMHLEPL